MNDQNGSKPEEAQAPEQAPPQPPDPGLLDKVFDRATVSGAGALAHADEIVPRKRISFEVDGADCAPGMFVDEAGEPITFQLTLHSLTGAEEIKVTKGVSDPAEAVQMTAKASIEALNGSPVVGDKLEFLWEALAPSGRQLVLSMYQEIGALSPAGLGKALASSTRR
jgi:hypothetical protein